MTEKLVAEEGLLKGLVLSLNGESEEEWAIGRDPDSCRLLVEDPMVSRKHLLCRRTNRGIEVENLSHTNPSLLNGEEISAPTLLKQGDLLQIGSGFFRFLAEAEAHVYEEGEEEAQEEVEKKHPSLFEEEIEDEERELLAAIDFEMTETGRWLLKVVGGPNSGAEFFMQPDHTYLIGTDPTSCDVVFHDTSVSRRHAKITVSNDEEPVVMIEDLGSKNGTLLDGEALEEKRQLTPNQVVTMGTTSFVLFDREGSMQTIISPMLPSIVKKLQEGAAEEKEEVKETVPQKREEAKSKTNQTALGAFILIGILTGLFIVIGFGVASLFRATPVVVEIPTDVIAQIDQITAAFPAVRYSYNKGSGRVLLVGHVLTASDKNQLIYNLRAIGAIKQIDDRGIIVDEFVWREINQTLNRNPSWRGITVSSPKAGAFVLSGYLKTRREAAELSDFMTANFPYPDLLQSEVVVEENVVSAVETLLQNQNIFNVRVELKGGEISLRGTVDEEQNKRLIPLIKEIGEVRGVRRIKNFVTLAAPEKAMIDLTGRYRVSGFSRIGDNVSVVINGRILTKGDLLDGMTITEIDPQTIFLQKGQVLYRIDYK